MCPGDVSTGMCSDWASPDLMTADQAAEVVPRLVFKAHRLLYHSTLGSRVIKKKRISDWASPDLQTADQAAMVVSKP